MPEKTKPLTLEGLDEFDKDEIFEYRGQKWKIPAISQQTAEMLADLADKIRPAIEKEDYKEVLKFDIEYIATAMADGNSEKIKELKEELKTWKKRVLGTISRYIATVMQGPVEEVIPEEEKDKAKK
jgi:hypothetical protein